MTWCVTNIERDMPANDDYRRVLFTGYDTQRVQTALRHPVAHPTRTIHRTKRDGTASG